MARVVQFKQVFETPLSKREARRASDTRQRILDAADQLFGQHGYRATSVRALTEAAGVNLAAVNYHFGSKADLLRATLERHIGPINAERLARLDALEREHPGRASVERILDALYRPAFEFRHAASGSKEVVQRVAALLHTGPEEVAPVFERLFGEMTRRFCDALARSLPGLSRSEIELRFVLGIGSMILLLSGRSPLALADGTDPVAALVAFVAAGFEGTVRRA